MSRQAINLGALPQGVGGDTPRSANTKVNDMTSELYTALGAPSGTGALPTALPVANGGTGGTTQAAARTGLGLGTASTANVTTTQFDGTSNQVMKVGDFGLGATTNPWAANAIAFTTTRFFSYGTGATSNIPSGADYGEGIIMYGTNVNEGTALFMNHDTDRVFGRRKRATAWQTPYEFYTTANTTRGSGGVLSAASPIVRLAGVSDSLRLDLQEQTFKPCGEWGVANEEANGVAVERLSVGVYKITGSLGLALEGWRTHDPSSPDGGRMLGVTTSTQENDGSVIISLFKQKWTLNADGEMVSSLGAPMEVPLNSWIDVRLEMPKPESQP